MRVDYKVCGQAVKSEWVCFEHKGYPRQKAVQWWQRRSPDPVPDTAAGAVEVADNGGVAFTTAIRVRAVAGERYETIIDHEIGPLPEAVPAGPEAGGANDETPF